MHPASKPEAKRPATEQQPGFPASEPQEDYVALKRRIRRMNYVMLAQLGIRVPLRVQLAMQEDMP